MTEAITKGDGSLNPRLEAMGEGSAETVSTTNQKTVCPTGLFQKVGEIEMERSALRITYESFNKTHVVFISKGDLGRLIQGKLDGPAAVYRVIIAGDTETYEKCGHAHRSLSGKALIVATTTSGGDISSPWLTVLKVINGRKKTCQISRVRDISSHSQQPPAPVRDLYAGLDRGF